MRVVLIEDMGTYISRLQNKNSQYIVNQNFFDMCLEAEQRP